MKPVMLQAVPLLLHKLTIAIAASLLAFALTACQDPTATDPVHENTDSILPGAHDAASVDTYLANQFVKALPPQCRGTVDEKQTSVNIRITCDGMFALYSISGGTLKGPESDCDESPADLKAVVERFGVVRNCDEA